MIPVADFFATDDTPLATGLLTAGAQPALIDNARRFVYREFGHGDRGPDMPLKRGPDGRPTTPGRVTLFLDKQDIDLPALVRAFQERKADVEIEEYIETLPEPYRSRLQALLPLAYMAYGHTLDLNRRAVLKAIKEARPFLRLKRPDGSFQLMPAERWEKASPAEKARILNS